MDYNYHTHTFRCGHADGLEEEYVLSAISAGIKCMGFSEHAPLRFSNGYESKYRLSIAEIKLYFNELLRLKEKYKDQIDIKIGFEFEYYHDMFDQMLKDVVEWGAEYLLVGEHFYSPICEKERIKHSTEHQKDDYEGLRSYVDAVVSAIKTKKFTYVCHPDMISVVGDKKIYQEQMERLCVASKEYDIPVEINFLGIRENRLYPNEWFWEVAGKVGCPVTFGFDAHTAKDAGDRESLKRANELVKKYNLNYIGKPKLILLK